jgi:oxalate decarboxylase/phosphoglucose isomerase-like protein (cupin superfamily)
MSVPTFVTHEDELDAFGFDWGRITVTTSPQINGSSGLSTAVVVMEPGQGHARHNHPGAEEVIYVLSGTGEQMVEDERGNPIVQTVGPGTTIYVPASRFHYTVNSGDTAMKVFVVYTPAGSELALRDLPDFRPIPQSR